MWSLDNLPDWQLQLQLDLLRSQPKNAKNIASTCTHIPTHYRNNFYKTLDAGF